MLKSSMRIKLGELFCGPGGMAIGAQYASEDFKRINGGEIPIEHVWGVDRDPRACETYKHNLSGVAVCEDANDFVNDVSECTYTISTLPKIDALAFGFPCNDFSLVGKQKGLQGKYGNLYKAGVEAIRKTNPLFFIAENVSGIHSANSGEAFRQILKDLANAGNRYNIKTHLYRFEEYGIPQTRHRYIIVGFRKDARDLFGNLIDFGIPSTDLYSDVDVSCRTTLEPIDSELPNSERTRQSDNVIWRLLFTPPGENAWKLDEIVTWSDDNKILDYLYRIPWYKEKIEPLGTIEDIRDKIEECRLHVKTGSKMSHIYRRLIADKPSYTITGSGGGGTHVYHWEQPRALTNRERARLQSFRDDFVFVGSKEEVRKQIGMAVPPKGAQIIFKAVLDSIAGIKYPSLERPSYDPL